MNDTASHATVPTDAALLQHWEGEGDEAAFQELCQRHAGMIAATCRRLHAPDPDEATQAVLLLLARRPRAVRDPGRLAGWLLGTTWRVVDHQRRSARRRRRHEQEAAAMRTAHHAEAEPQDWAEHRQLLDEALRRLTPARREAVVRFYLLGRPQAEVAAELGCSIDAVKTRIHEALTGMRDFFARRGAPIATVALVSGFANEAAAAQSVPAASHLLAAAHTTTGSSAATLAYGVQTQMLIKHITLVSSLALIGASAIGSAMLLAAEPSVSRPATTTPMSAAGQRPVSTVTTDDGKVLSLGDNAALDWWRAIGHSESIEDVYLQKVEAVADGSPRLADKDIKNKFSHTTLRSRLLAMGAKKSSCEWGVNLRDAARGFTMPHINRLGHLVELCLLRAQAPDAEPAASVDDLLLALRVCRLAIGARPAPAELAWLGYREQLALKLAARLAPELSREERQRLAAGLLLLPGLPTERVLNGQEDIDMGTLIAARTTVNREERRAFVKAVFPKAESIPDHLMTDTAIDQMQQQLQALYARHQSFLTKPLAQRIQSFVTVPGAGGHANLEGLLEQKSVAVGREAAVLSVGKEIHFLHLQAILGLLEGGRDGFNAVVNPIDGRSFRCELVRDAYQVVTDIPGYRQITTRVSVKSPVSEEGL